MKTIGRSGCCIALLLAAMQAFAQGVTVSNTAKPVVNTAIMPYRFRQIAAALGDRVTTPGKERLTMTGTLTRGDQSGPATVTIELPNKIRIDQSGAKTATLIFDGNSASSSAGALAEADQDLLESFMDDSPESMLANLRQTSLRIISRRARLDNGQFASILELIGPVASRSLPRQKHYYFDFGTRLPVVTRYRLRHGDGSTVLVETERKNWTTVAGEAVPGDIARSENGTVVAAFHLSGAAFSAAANDGLFGGKQ